MKPTGRIFKLVTRWIPTGKLFDSCTSKVDSEPPHGSNVDIPHIHECKQTLDVSAEWQRFVTLVKQSQELKTVSYHKLYDILKQHQNEVNEIRTERLARTANPLALSTRNRGKAIVTSSAPTYDPEPATVTEDEEMSKEKEIDKLMALISLSFKKIYKPTNNNLRTSSNTSRANQDNSPRTNRGTGYDNQRAINVAGARENVGDSNITIDSSDICYDRAQDDQDETDDLDQERDLLASLIQKLKCEIDDSKNRNKFLESSNKELVDKLKGEIEDFKTKNKSLESSNNHFKEANNELSKTNQLMFKDLKKFQAELDKYNDVNYASKVEIDCAKAKGDLMSYKIDFEKSSNAYTQQINDLNQTISDMKKELCAHQETISIMSQAKEAQIKLYKTREDKELDKVIALENKVKVLNDIVYKTGQSVQTMNMLNRNCKTSFAKPEFLKKAQRANPHLYDIGCYNDNLALMLAPDSDETIRLDKERRSKLSDLIRPSDYDQLNNLYDLFVPRREKSAEQHYFPKTSKMSHTSFNKEFSKILNEINRLSREYYYANHMNAILGVYTNVDEVTNLQCDYLETLEKCERLEKELSKSRTIEKIKTDKSFKENHSNVFLKECEEYVEIQDLKAQLQDKGIAISELKKLIEKTKGKSVETKFEKSLVIRQPNAFQSILGSITIKRVYYVEGLNHNLFSVGQFCDADLEIAFRKSTCYIRDLKGNDLLTGSRSTDLYSITLQDSTTPNPICLMAKPTSSQAWLWHRRLSHLNFDIINLLLKNNIVNGLPKLRFVKDHMCSSCELGKAKRISFHTKTTPSSERRDGENLDKMKEKGDACIFVGYSTQSKGYRVFNKRTRMIVETIHVNFDELPQMVTDHVSSDPVPQCPATVLEQDSSGLNPQCQMMSVHNSSGLNPQCQMTFEHISSGLNPQCQMMSVHNSSGLDPQCLMTFEQNGSSLAPQCQQKFIKQLR
ncbi:retrovirus-related pol polyprotein from transposon TNT 1-94 [Tanacetum coccineum]